jgi:hypothetical protein
MVISLFLFTYSEAFTDKSPPLELISAILSGPAKNLSSVNDVATILQEVCNFVPHQIFKLLIYLFWQRKKKKMVAGRSKI